MTSHCESVQVVHDVKVEHNNESEQSLFCFPPVVDSQSSPVSPRSPSLSKKRLRTSSNEVMTNIKPAALVDFVRKVALSPLQCHQSLARRSLLRRRVRAYVRWSNKYPHHFRQRCGSKKEEYSSEPSDADDKMREERAQSKRKPRRTAFSPGTAKKFRISQRESSDGTFLWPRLGDPYQADIPPLQPKETLVEPSCEPFWIANEVDDNTADAFFRSVDRGPGGVYLDLAAVCLHAAPSNLERARHLFERFVPEHQETAAPWAKGEDDLFSRLMDQPDTKKNFALMQTQGLDRSRPQLVRHFYQVWNQNRLKAKTRVNEERARVAAETKRELAQGTQYISGRELLHFVRTLAQVAGDGFEVSEELECRILDLRRRVRARESDPLCNL